MRTKSLLLAAALGFTSVATSQAEVYSVNAVGFVNKTIEANKFYLVANPLKVGNNLLSEVLPTVPDGTSFYKFQNGGWARYIYDGGWTGPGVATQTLAPGEGGFIKSPAGSPTATITFVGEVMQGQDLTIAIPAGFSVRASIVPQSLPLSSGDGSPSLGFPAVDGDTVWLFTDRYVRYIYDGGWTPSTPQPAVAESFFVKKMAPGGTWTRSFSVNP